MDYEKLHKDTITKLQEMVNSGKITVEVARGICADFIPESEDERIRKEIKNFFSRIMLGQENFLREDYDWNAWIAWIEKQDNPKSYSWKPTKEQFEALDYAYNSCSDTERGNYYEGVLETLIKDLHRLEKQCEQKPTDKVKPKFHEGDWVILTAGELSTTLQIVKIDTNKKLYWFNDSSYLPIVDEECLHFWTIQDAKDGDVLATEPTEGYYSPFYSPFVAIYKKQNGEDFDSYCFIGFDGKFYKGENGHSTEKIHPATKEQRDILFAKMKEAGYEWDAEKKELKKIEQKPAWSEEDDEMLKMVIKSCEQCGNEYAYYWLKNLKNRVQPLPQQEWSEEEIEKAAQEWDSKANFNPFYMTMDGDKPTDVKQDITTHKESFKAGINWILKSLKLQSHWKPSDEQMNAFDAVLVYNPPCSNECRNHLITLYNELKKLREG